MSAFVDAIDALFADPNHSHDALWLPKGQAVSYPVRVVRRSPTIETGFGGSRIASSAHTFTVRVSDVPKPIRGDRIEVDGKTYAVTSEPRIAAQQLFWDMETAQSA